MRFRPSLNMLIVELVALSLFLVGRLKVSSFRRFIVEKSLHLRYLTILTVVLVELIERVSTFFAEYLGGKLT